MFTSGERRNNTAGVVIFLINISCCSEERIPSDVLPPKVFLLTQETTDHRIIESSSGKGWKGP